MAFENLHPRIEEVLGRVMPAEHSVAGLDDLPPHVLADATRLHERCGSLVAFAYLFHTTTATFGDVKAFCSERGWTTSVDE